MQSQSYILSRLDEIEIESTSGVNKKQLGTFFASLVQCIVQGGGSNCACKFKQILKRRYCAVYK